MILGSTCKPLQYNNCKAIQPSNKIGKGTVKIHACFKVNLFPLGCVYCCIIQTHSLPDQCDK